MKKIEDIRILVAGDIMLDKYICGDVERISPEAPVLIIEVDKEYETLGGCGNVIRNLRELGVKVSCITGIGCDDAGISILNQLEKLEVNKMAELVKDENFVTTIKTRYIANLGDTPVFRSDKEKIKSVKLDYIDIPEDYDIIIVSDYAKGVVTESLMLKLKLMNKKIIVDPKPQNKHLYYDIFMITPNKKECDMMYKNMEHSHYYNIKYILRTLGKDGMELFKSGRRISYASVSPVNVYNVSGAGDTVVSIIGVCVALGIDVEIAMEIANKSAQYVVTQPGTSVVPKSIFEKLLKEKDDGL